MYPDLSYLFHDLFGTPVDNAFSIIKTFGLVLVFALITAGLLLKSELKRLEKDGKIKPSLVKKSNSTGVFDAVLNSFILGFIASKLPLIMGNFDQFSENPASIILSLKGNNWVGLAVFMISAIYFYRKIQTETPETTEVLQYPSQKTNDIVIVAGISGVVGAKLFSAFEDLSSFFKDPFGTLLSGSGLNVYGGIIVAFFVVYWYVKKLGIKPVYMMDIAGMGILLGYAIGRIGCQLSGDGDWGIVAAAQPSWWFLPDWLWSYNYPHNVNNDGQLMSICNVELINSLTGISMEQKCQQACGMRYAHELSPKVYPTPLYEIVISLVFLAILWANRTKFKIPGTIFALYLILNGVERFFIEQIRVNDRYPLMGLNWSQAQYISVLFVLLGIAGLVYLYKIKKPETSIT